MPEMPGRQEGRMVCRLGLRLHQACLHGTLDRAKIVSYAPPGVESFLSLNQSE